MRRISIDMDDGSALRLVVDRDGVPVDVEDGDSHPWLGGRARVLLPVVTGVAPMIRYRGQSGHDEIGHLRGTVKHHEDATAPVSWDTLRAVAGLGGAA